MSPRRTALEGAAKTYWEISSRVHAGRPAVHDAVVLEWLAAVRDVPGPIRNGAVAALRLLRPAPAGFIPEEGWP